MSHARGRGRSLSRTPGAGGPAALPADPSGTGGGFPPPPPVPVAPASLGPVDAQRGGPLPSQEGKCRFLVRLTSRKEGSQRPCRPICSQPACFPGKVRRDSERRAGGLLLLMEHHKAKFSVGPRAACGLSAQLLQLTPRPPPPGDACGCGELLPQAHGWSAPPAPVSAAQPEGPWVLLSE